MVPARYFGLPVTKNIYNSYNVLRNLVHNLWTNSVWWNVSIVLSELAVKSQSKLLFKLKNISVCGFKVLVAKKTGLFEWGFSLQIFDNISSRYKKG